MGTLSIDINLIFNLTSDSRDLHSMFKQQRLKHYKMRGAQR